MGGVERASVNTANALSELNFDVYYISLFNKLHFFKPNPNVKIIEPQGFNEYNLSFIKTILYLRNNIKKINPNYILIFGKIYGAFLAISLLGTHYSYYLSERSSPLYKWQFPFNWINRIAYSLNPPKGVIAQTSIAAEFQKKYYRNSIVDVIPNIVREVKLYPDIQREKILLAVGRLNDHLKGFDLLLKALFHLKNQDWMLHLAGGDGNTSNLKALALNLGINHRIKFLGKITDIDLLYAKAGIFVIPSRSEGFPNALLEAMSAGCCCVSFDFIAGPRDIIVDGYNGILVERENYKKLAEVLDYLIENEKLRNYLGNNAKKIIETHNGELYKKKLLQFLNS
ncbi:glycosyltransferase [Thermaurantimonas sp.]|uniref:glycosyltransferase n=1 Tax=Thermaurantimonas sp. TaxID=2681568 RepID=UPI00391C2B6C